MQESQTALAVRRSWAPALEPGSTPSWRRERRLTAFRPDPLPRLFRRRAPEGTDLLQLCFAPESLQQLLEEIDQMD